MRQSSGRGGKRTGAGRKSSWQQSPTRSIRVPASYVELLLAVAQQLEMQETTALVEQSYLTTTSATRLPTGLDGQLHRQMELFDGQTGAAALVAILELLQQRLGVVWAESQGNCNEEGRQRLVQATALLQTAHLLLEPYL